MLTVNEVAEHYWQMLETQSSLGWKTLKDVPVPLRKLCPLKWCRDYETKEGMRLLYGYYRYDTERASEVLQRLQFDVVRQFSR